MTSLLHSLDIADWNAAPAAADAARLTAALEGGGVLFLPRLAFALRPDEQRFLDPRWSDGRAKNVSYDPATAQIRHTSAEGTDREALAALIARYAAAARTLVCGLCPVYGPTLEWGLTSYRPVAVEGRPASVTKDDTRVHIDAFASRPNRGRRILRVFCNVNPHGVPRSWELGEAFERVAARFRPRLPAGFAARAWLMERLGVTRGRRSPYDALMLALHDGAKRDEAYQAGAPREPVAFPPGSTWVVYSDRVMHAALGGQYLLEQTFYLPVAAMQDPALSPLRVLEGLYGRALA